MKCEECPLAKFGKEGKPTIRRQKKFENKLRFVLSHPQTNFVDPEVMESSTVLLLQRFISVPFDVVFTKQCVQGKDIVKPNGKLKSVKTERIAVANCKDTCQADLVGAEVVVICGNRAIEAMGLTRKAGSSTGWIGYDEAKGVSVLLASDPHDVEEYPTNAFKDFIWTLQQAEKIVLGKAPRRNILPEVKRVDVNSVAEFDRLVGLIPDGAVVACDIETGGLNPWRDSEPIIQLGVEHPTTGPMVLPASVFEDPGFPAVWAAFNRRVKLLGQNFKFDGCYLVWKLGIEVTIAYDTQLTHHLIDERQGTHKMDRMVQIYLNWADYWSELEHYLKLPGGYLNAPYAQLADYLAYDLVGTRLLWEKFQGYLRDDRGNTTYPWKIFLSQKDYLDKVYTPLLNELLDVEVQGNSVNVATIHKLIAELDPIVEAERLALEGQLFDVTGKEYSLGSPQQLLEAFHEMGIIDEDVTSIDQRILKDYIDHPVVRDLMQYKKKFTLLNNFLKGIFKPRGGKNSQRDQLVFVSDTDVRAMTNFNIAGTIGPRWSANSPNLQQAPKKGPFKSIFIPSQPGRIIFQNDFSALEARVAAYLSGDMVLAKACQEDLHQLVAEKSFVNYFKELELLDSMADVDRFVLSQGMLMSAQSGIKALPGKLKPGEDLFDKSILLLRDHLRSCAKAITYGIFFGRGARALANQELMCHENEAKFFIDEYFKLFPGLHKWILSVKRLVKEEGIIITPCGRVRDLRGWMFSHEEYSQKRFLAEGERKAVNFMTQGFGGTLQNLAFVKAGQYLRKHKIGRLRAGVHDSTVGEIDLNKDTRFHLLEIQKLQEGVFPNPSWLCKIDVECGPSWGEVQKMEKYFAEAGY